MIETSVRDLRSVIQRVVDGQELSIDEAADALDQIMTGDATPAQIGALLVALRMRGETIEEIAGFVRTMRKHATPVELRDDPRPVVDTCGTGGDGAGTFNISTTAAFVVAGAGVRVAKHGNRSMTSRCGSADLLEGLGATLAMRPGDVADSVHEVGIGFMFAQAFHPAMRFVAPIRKEIGTRTIFNVLGPLTNPARVQRQLIGVSSVESARKLARVLLLAGGERGLVVSSEGGVDEITAGGATHVVAYDGPSGSIEEYTIHPADFGLDVNPIAALAGGDVAANVAITQAVLAGEPGPRRDATLLNAGAALFAAGACGSIAEGIDRAGEAIESGAALDTAERFVAFSRQRAGAAR